MPCLSALAGPADCRGDPLPDSCSSASAGICKFNFGLEPPLEPLVSLRGGATNSALEEGLAGCGGCLLAEVG